MTRETQQQKVLELLMLGAEIDLTMTPFTTKLSTRIFETQRKYGLTIVRGWRKVGRFRKAIRTYKLVSKPKKKAVFMKDNDPYMQNEAWPKWE